MHARLIFCAIAVLAALPAQAAGLDATAVLQRADAAMGAAGLKTLRYIERLKLSVDRILPLHGRIVPMSELNRTIGR